MGLPESTPEAQGIPSLAILDFLAAAEQHIDALHSIMLVRHGHTVAQGWWFPYQADEPHMLFSLSKSFTSTAVGLAVAQGLLSPDDAVLKFFSEEAPAVVTDHLAAMRVRHLLTMTTGHNADTVAALEPTDDGNWAKAILALPVEYEPGTHFVYNSGASYLLSAIVQRVSGVTLLEYLRPRLLEPLGIRDATWETCRHGVNVGGWGLSLRTAEVARFGQLYLQQGAWHGQQLIPRDWVAAATGYQVSNDGREAEIDWRQGYGFQFWRCRYGAYRGDGAFGQLCVVMPEQDAVLVITAGSPDMQGMLDLVWTHLLPAMGPSALPGDTKAQDRLAQMLAGLSLQPVPGTPSSPVAARVSGWSYFKDTDGDRVWFESLTLTAGPDGVTLTFRDQRGSYDVVAGYGEWRLGTTSIMGGPPQPIAVSGAWQGDDTYVARACLIRTPYLRTLTIRLDGDTLTLDARDNVSFGPVEHPRISATARQTARAPAGGMG